MDITLISFDHDISICNLLQAIANSVLHDININKIITKKNNDNLISVAIQNNIQIYLCQEDQTIPITTSLILNESQYSNILCFFHMDQNHDKYYDFNAILKSDVNKIKHKTIIEYTYDSNNLLVHKHDLNSTKTCIYRQLINPLYKNAQMDYYINISLPEIITMINKSFKTVELDDNQYHIDYVKQICYEDDKVVIYDINNTLFCTLYRHNNDHLSLYSYLCNLISCFWFKSIKNVMKVNMNYVYHRCNLKIHTDFQYNSDIKLLDTIKIKISDNIDINYDEKYLHDISMKIHNYARRILSKHDIKLSFAIYTFKKYKIGNDIKYILEGDILTPNTCGIKINNDDINDNIELIKRYHEMLIDVDNVDNVNKSITCDDVYDEIKYYYENVYKQLIIINYTKKSKNKDQIVNIIKSLKMYNLNYLLREFDTNKINIQHKHICDKSRFIINIVINFDTIETYLYNLNTNDNDLYIYTSKNNMKCINHKSNTLYADPDFVDTIGKICHKLYYPIQLRK